MQQEHFSTSTACYLLLVVQAGKKAWCQHQSTIHVRKIWILHSVSFSTSPSMYVWCMSSWQLVYFQKQYNNRSPLIHPLVYIMVVTICHPSPRVYYIHKPFNCMHGPWTRQHSHAVAPPFSGSRLTCLGLPWCLTLGPKLAAALLVLSFFASRAAL